VLSGERLAPEQRQDFLHVGGQYLQQARDRQITLEQQHSFQAEAAGVDPARVVPDVIGPYREWAPLPPGGATPIQKASKGLVGNIIEGGKEMLGIGQPPAPDAISLGTGKRIKIDAQGNIIP